MKHGFVKVAAATPDIRVADVKYNTEKICQAIEEASDNCAKILVFPELCVTGYTCGDLFTQDILLKSAKEALFEIAKFTAGKDILVFAGLPLEMDGKLYNVAAALNEGKVIGLTTKTFLPNYGEFYEMRQFTPDRKKQGIFLSGEKRCPSGPGFCLRRMKWIISLSLQRSVRMYGLRFRPVSGLRLRGRR